ncbi:PHD finger protein MALE STERILITY 1 [Lactuca sativa]|uniref:PHD finger protein MALE STERILITY 1 n=1 Tax=Lactuca sativa TaxID=4236 RepID=UPI000CB35149|nr:PHD finger protein MALE STERILITY 1 [Lactuca sativa]
MSSLDPSGCKKRKRVERVFKFKAFGEQGYPIESCGTFRDNVKALLEYGNVEMAFVNGMTFWSFQLEVHRHPPSHVLLFVVEESVEASLNRHCKHCIYVGWGDHMICNKKYHFLVPSKDTMTAFLSYEGNHSNIVMGKLNFVELNGHTMHGVLHSNGFGHLLCINGLEMGSDLAGHLVMEFWNRLCSCLQARKVSLIDLAKHKSMDMRLLHGVAYGQSWFGQWGYHFGRGSFGVTQQMYQKALDALQNIPLCIIAQNIGTSNMEIPLMLSRYQTLSSRSLVTLSDLLRFMLDLKSRLPKESTLHTYNPGILVENSCRWSPKRIEMAARVIVESLKKAKFRWVSRQEVRDAARAYVGDTGLLDFVLKSLGNHVVGKYLVRRCLNPVTKVLEYCLEDISNALPNQEEFITNDSKLKTRCKISRVQLMSDMFCIYRHILKGQTKDMDTTITSTISLASRIILDSKYFVKDYSKETPLKLEPEVGEKSKLYCTITIQDIEEINSHEECRKKLVTTPYETIMLRNNATFNDLVDEVEKNFKEIYWGLKSFMFGSIMNLNPKGSDQVFRVTRSGSRLVFQGKLVETGMNHESIYESGSRQSFIVDCACGAKDDDGERMVACDICEVWQHTRCLKIPNNEEIPNIYVCNRCEQDILVLPALP